MPQDACAPVVVTRPPDSTTLRRAALAVGVAVHALGVDPTSPTVSRAVESAGDAVAQLPAGVVATTMRRLLDTVDECSRAGLCSCARLTAQRGAAARAMRLAS